MDVAVAPEQAVYFQPQVAVDEAGGVNVTYFELATGRIDVFLARSTDRGTTFGSPQRITSQAFDPAVGAVGQGGKGSWFLGDYQGLAAGQGMIHALWSDTRTGRLEIFTAAVPVGR